MDNTENIFNATFGPIFDDLLKFLVCPYCVALQQVKIGLTYMCLNLLKFLIATLM